MKFQEDISNMNTYVRTYIHTYIRTSRNQYAPPLFQSWGHKNGNFQVKECYIFLIFAQNIDSGYMLEPPQCSNRKWLEA